MNKLLHIALLACMFSVTGLAFAQNEHVATFDNVTGQVVVLRGKTKLIAVAGTKLLRTDVVRSGPKSSGHMLFRDGTRLTVGASTEIEIRSYVFQPEESKYDFNVFLKKGSATYSSGKLGKLAPEAVNLNTPRASTGIRGIHFTREEE